MIISIVAAKAHAKEVRIRTDSKLEDVLDFLKVLGIADWNLNSKGTVSLESNGPDLFVALGPLKVVDKKKFLTKAVAWFPHVE